MARIAVFRALRYNPEKISFISRVVAPPYDLIDAEQAEALRRRDPHNIIRLILGKEGAVPRQEAEYQEAARVLAKWREEGVLVQEQVPSAYLCEQEFELHGRPLVRRGLLCALLLEETGPGRALPHEQTLPGPKADRLRLIAACRAHLSPIFLAFSDPHGQGERALAELATGEPIYEFCDDAMVAYRVWQVPEGPGLRRLGALLRERHMFIADGHHRYESALAYRQARKDPHGPPSAQPEDFALAYCVSASSPGLVTLPTHRLVNVNGLNPDALLAQLAESFAIELAHVPHAERLAELAQALAGLTIICYLRGGRAVILRPRAQDTAGGAGEQEWRRAPTVVLHEKILGPLLGIGAGSSPGDAPRLSYCQDPREVYWQVEAGRADAGFLVPPTPPRLVEQAVLAGGRMPAKSTFFYPKIASGLVILPLDESSAPLAL